MRDRKNLTKSLHTVSAVSNLALYLRGASSETHRAKYWVDEALAILGHPGTDEWPADDDTVLRCVATVKKAMGEK